MNALKCGEFDALVMSQESRLGREAIETAYALKQIVSAGVRVFFFLEGNERTLETPTDKLLMSVAAFADELERDRARQARRAAHQRSVGGDCASQLPDGGRWDGGAPDRARTQ